MALPSALFTAVAGLQQLRLDHNQLSVVSSRLLHPLARLVVMDLSHNLLQTECDSDTSPSKVERTTNLREVNSARRRPLLGPSLS